MSPEFPLKRVGAGLLVTNGDGEVLLVEPTYKPRWEIPGGVAEHGESPRQAAARECREELGVAVEPGELLVVEYRNYEKSSHGSDGVMFVFDGGERSSTDGLVLPDDELSAAAFVAPSELDSYLSPWMTRRILASIEARAAGCPRYIES